MPKRNRAIRRRQEEPSIVSKRSPDTNKRVARWICAALVVLAVLPYLQTFGHEFVDFDDEEYVAKNLLVQQGLSWSNVAWAFSTTSISNWHPLTWLSHMLDCQVFGLRPGWHHLVSTLLHGANTALLFVVLRIMTRMAWRSALVAALFALHPLHVESVAWIAERKDVLSTFFGLWALWAYARYAAAPSFQRYGLVACFFALSLLSKPMLVTLPFVLFLLDVWPLRRLRRESRNPKPGSLVLEKLPLLAMSAASSVVTLEAQYAGGALAAMNTLQLSQRLANAIGAYVGYLSKAFWPVDLAVLYPLPDHASATKTVLAMLAIGGITTGVCVVIRRRPWLAVGWMWFLGTLVPVIGLVQVGGQSMADRYTYVPLIGVFIMIAWSLPAAAFAATNRARVAVTAAVVALTLAALATVTFAQIQVWKNTTTLFDHAVKVTEGNFIAYNGLGVANVSLGRLDAAIANYRQALELNPSYVDALVNLASAFFAQGKYDEAIETDEKVLRLRPDLAETHLELGAALWNRGRTAESILHNRKAIELNPDLLDARLNLGLALFKEGNYDEAVTHLEYVLRLNPQHEAAQRFLNAARQKRAAAATQP